jgi:hypothetical protein
MYVGKSTNGLARPSRHSFPSNLERYAQLPISKWIRALHKRGLEAKVVVLEECAKSDDLDEAERFHIAYFRALFGKRKLLNVTDGGGGTYGYRYGKQALLKMSKDRKARASTTEGRKRMSDMASNYWVTKEAREQQRKERLGKKWDAETKAKISASHKGKQKSAEHRVNLSVSAKLRCADPAYREKQRQAQIIAQSRPEVVAKKSAAAKKQWDAKARAKKSEEVKEFYRAKRRGEKIRCP